MLPMHNLVKRTLPAFEAGECGMIVYEKNTHSRTRSFLYIESFLGILSLATPYIGAKMWYAFRLV
jgi:hypothetical protein